MAGADANFQSSLTNVRSLGDGSQKITSMADGFNHCTALLTFSGFDPPGTNGAWASTVVTMQKMFSGATKVEIDEDDANSWNVYKVQTMDSMFFNAQKVLPSQKCCSGWNVREVTSMRKMFQNAGVANPDISAWQTPSLTGCRLGR
mgnify:CR=1 FL=1